MKHRKINDERLTETSKAMMDESIKWLSRDKGNGDQDDERCSKEARQWARLALDADRMAAEAELTRIEREMNEKKNKQDNIGSKLRAAK